MEITDQTIIEEILSKSDICRLAMVDGDQPYMLAFNYGYRDGKIYIHCAREGRKIDVLKQNNRVCFEIEQGVELVKHKKACGWATRYRSLVGYANVEILTGFVEKEDALKVIMVHNGAEGEINFEEKAVNATAILKLNITEVVGKQSKNWDD